MTQKNNNHHEKKTRHEIFSEKDSQIAWYNIDMTQPKRGLIDDGKLWDRKKKNRMTNKTQETIGERKTTNICVNSIYISYTQCVCVCCVRFDFTYTKLFCCCFGFFSNWYVFQFPMYVWLGRMVVLLLQHTERQIYALSNLVPTQSNCMARWFCCLAARIPENMAWTVFVFLASDLISCEHAENYVCDRSRWRWGNVRTSQDDKEEKKTYLSMLKRGRGILWFLDERRKGNSIWSNYEM